jgi:hypothetical protein
MWREQRIPGASWVTDKLGKAPLAKGFPTFKLENAEIQYSKVREVFDPRLCESATMSHQIILYLRLL